MLNDQQCKDGQFIKETMLWPSWPWLPVKRSAKVGMPDCAALFDKGDGTYPVYMENLFTMADKCKTDPDFMKKVEVKVYPTLEALLMDGWMVD